MIDWLNVLGFSLWIVALAAWLAAGSFSLWEADLRGVKKKEILNSALYHKVFSFAGILFSLGLGLVSLSWERIVWFVLSFLFSVQFVSKWLKFRRDA